VIGWMRQDGSSKPGWRKARLLVVLVAVLGVCAGAYATSRPAPRVVVAEFDRTTGLYAGSDVRILGVKVGEVLEVEPRGKVVRVTMEIDSDRPVPDDAMAAIVAPSLVSGRYVQIAPAYAGGPTLDDGELIPRERTAIPVEWDDIRGELTRLTTALAPKGQSQDGSLSRTIKASSELFEGNGAAMRDALSAMADASETLSGNRASLFQTVRNLAQFIAALNDSGTQIEAFTREFASISALLNENRTQVRTLLKQANVTAREIHDFVTENADGIDSSVAGLTSLSRQLADNQVNIANILHLAPTTVANFYNIYDPTAGTLTGRLAVGQTMGLSNAVCQAIFSAGGTLADCQRALGPLLDMFNIESLPISVNPLNQPGTSNQADPGDQHPRSDGNQPTPPASDEGSDPIDELAHLLLGGTE